MLPSVLHDIICIYESMVLEILNSSLFLHTMNPGRKTKRCGGRLEHSQRVIHLLRVTNIDILQVGIAVLLSAHSVARLDKNLLTIMQVTHSEFGSEWLSNRSVPLVTTFVV